VTALPPLAATEPCPSCGSSVAAVLIALEARVVTMRSCNECDQRWWTQDGEAVDPLSVFSQP
jgi:hypothetical protein